METDLGLGVGWSVHSSTNCLPRRITVDSASWYTAMHHMDDGAGAVSDCRTSALGTVSHCRTIRCLGKHNSYFLTALVPGNAFIDLMYLACFPSHVCPSNCIPVALPITPLLPHDNPPRHQPSSAPPQPATHPRFANVARPRDGFVSDELPGDGFGPAVVGDLEAAFRKGRGVRVSGAQRGCLGQLPGIAVGMPGVGLRSETLPSCMTVLLGTSIMGSMRTSKRC